MKTKIDKIIIGSFLAVFTLLSLFLIFFIRQTSYEQAIDGGLEINRSIEAEPTADNPTGPPTP